VHPGDMLRALITKKKEKDRKTEELSKKRLEERQDTEKTKL